jgi:hypothetical protein
MVNSGVSNDDPTFGIYKSAGKFDWLDEPGFRAAQNGIPMVGAQLTDSFISTLSNPDGATCSVSWSVTLLLVGHGEAFFSFH